MQTAVSKMSEKLVLLFLAWRKVYFYSNTICGERVKAEIIKLQLIISTKKKLSKAKYCHPYHQISAKNFFFVILIKDIPRPHEKYTNNVGNKSQTHFSVSLTHSVSDEVEGKIVNIFFNFRRREKESQNYSAMFTKSPSEIPVK